MPMTFEQQPKESAKAFAAFSLYLNLGAERSTAAVGKKLGKSEGLIERWAAKFDWTARVQSYAAHFALVERGAIEAAARGLQRDRAIPLPRQRSRGRAARARPGR